MTFKIFISHSIDNIGIVEQIKTMFEQKGMDAYVAVSHFQPGASILEKVKENIRSANYFLLLYTKSAEKSSWVQQEIGMALNMNKDIIPIIEENVAVPASLQGIEYVRLKKGDVSSCLQKVCDFLVEKKIAIADRNKLLGTALILVGAVLVTTMVSDSDDMTDIN